MVDFDRRVLVAIVIACVGVAAGCGDAVYTPNETPRPGPEAVSPGPPGVLVASGQNRPAAIAADSSGVYWIDEGVGVGTDTIDGAVMKASIDGSGVATVVSHLVAPKDIALDATTVYFLGAGTSVAGFEDGAVMSVNKDGGELTRLVPNQNRPTLLVADESSLYWFDAGTDALMKAAKDGTGLTALANRLRPRMLVLDATDVYFVDDETGSIEKIPKEGGAPVVIGRDATSYGSPSALAVDADDVYWSASDAILRMAKDGSALTVLAAPRNALALAIDGDALYRAGTASDGHPGDVLSKAPLGGGDETILAGAQPLSGKGFAIGPTSVYWTTSGTRADDLAGQGDVMMTAK